MSSNGLKIAKFDSLFLLTLLQMLEEFTDVSEEEKRFFRIWNAYIGSNTATPQKSIPFRSLDFVKKYGKQMSKCKMGELLVWHLTNLWDEGLISHFHLLACIHQYDLLRSGT